MDIEKRVRMGVLFDFYGELLTQKQQDVFKRYLHDDASLGEIALELGISRQAVRDSLLAAENSLELFESKLGLLNKHKVAQDKLNEIIAILKQDNASAKALNKIKELFQYL